MFVIDIDWIHIIIWALVFAFLILLKYVVTYFFLLRDTTPVVLGETRPRHIGRRPTLMWDITTRARYLNQMRPPPEFSTAMQNSLPVSYIEIEEPPPSYEECIKQWPSEKQTQNEIIQTNSEEKEKEKSPVILMV